MNTECEEIEVTQAVDVKAEWKAFEAWWSRWVPNSPISTSYIFDAWMEATRRSRTGSPTQAGLLREALVKLQDIQGQTAPQDYACNLIARIEAVVGEVA